MTPPMAKENAKDRATQPPEAVLSFVTMRRRPDFLACARAKRRACPAYFVQARNRDDGDPIVRVGYTCSKKVGNAVTRNRAKRRLRALARSVIPQMARAGWDYVLVGKVNATTTHEFAAMEDDLRKSLQVIHK